MITMNELVDLRMQQHIAHELYRQQIMQRIPDPFPAMLPVPIPRHIMLPPRVQLPGVDATLQNNDLWKQFHQIGTEMIITKSGRRMFPSMRISLTGLEDDVNYCVLLEMVPIGDCRYKFSGSQWVPAGGAEPQSPQRMYLHPDSPASGSHWQAQPILFNKVKLTNNTLDSNGHIVLTSMHKYQPRLHIIRTSDPTQIPWAPQQPFVFPETEFVAVTAYQNDRITKLKIDNNPFAKGFRETGQSRCKRKMTSSPNQQNGDSPIKLSNNDLRSSEDDDGNNNGSIIKRMRSNSSVCSISSLDDERGGFSISCSGSSSSGASSPIEDIRNQVHHHQQQQQQQHQAQHSMHLSHKSRNNELLMQHIHQNMQSLINPSIVDLACSYFGRPGPYGQAQFYPTQSAQAVMLSAANGHPHHYSHQLPGYYSSPSQLQHLNEHHQSKDILNGSPAPADIVPITTNTTTTITPKTSPSSSPINIKVEDDLAKLPLRKTAFTISAILGDDH